MISLEKNEQLIAYLREQNITNGRFIGQSYNKSGWGQKPKTKCYNAGKLETDEGEIELLLKIPQGEYQRNMQLKESIAFINALQHEQPHHLPILPTLYGMIITPSGKQIYVTEDFSKNSNITVQEVFGTARVKQIPQDITSFITQNMCPAKMFFDVGGELKLGDLDRPGLDEQLLSKYQIDTKHFEIRVNYEL